MNQRLIAAAAAIAVLATAACGGHGAGSPTPPVSGALKPFTGSPALANFDWGRESMQGAALIGRASFKHMEVQVLVNQQNAQGLVQYAQQVSDPSSPLYRQYLRPEDIANRFGASQQDYQNAANYFASFGLHVAGWPQRLGLAVAGSQEQMEHAFGTQFGTYELNGQIFAAPMTAPHFTQVEPVLAVSNLVSLRREHTYLVSLPPRAGAGTNTGYSPQQVRNAFDFNGAYGKGYTGTGITIGIIGTGPINVGDRSNLCDDKDVDGLKNLYNVSAAKVCEADVTNAGVLKGLGAPPSPIPTGVPQSPGPSPDPNGTPPTSLFPFAADFQTPPPVSASCSSSLPACNPEDGEAQIDTQQAATLAPGSTVKFYLAYNADDCYTFFPNTCATAPPSPDPNGNYGAPQIGIVESDPEIEEAIGENSADVISISYGLGEPQNVGNGFNSSGIGYQTEEFAALAAEGVAVFVSSGDDGSANCLSGSNSYEAKQCVSYPAGDVNVTSVGGVNAPINEFGQLDGNLTAWGTTSSLGTSGSGGGVSTIFPAPAWQKAALPGTAMRTQPDVAMIGDPFTGMTTYQNAGLGSSLADYGGTSVAAPQMAAMWALVLQACAATPSCATGPSGHPYRLGNAAPYVYSIYANQNLTGSFSPHLPYSQVFYDVLYGSNAMQNPKSKTASPVPGEIAGPGYDQTTGVGVPFAGHLIQAVTGQAVP